MVQATGRPGIDLRHREADPPPLVPRQPSTSHVIFSLHCTCTRLQRPSQGQCRGWGTALHSTPYTPFRLACVPPSRIAPWHGVWPLTDPLVRFGTKVKLHQPMSKTVAPPQRTAGQFPVPPSHAKLRVPIFHFTTARHAHCPSSSLHSSLTLFCSTSQPKCTLLGPSPWLVDSAAKPVVHLWEHYNLFFCFHRQLDLIHSLLPGSGHLKIKNFNHSAGRILHTATQRRYTQGAPK